MTSSRAPTPIELMTSALWTVWCAAGTQRCISAAYLAGADGYGWVGGPCLSGEGVQEVCGGVCMCNGVVSGAKSFDEEW